MQVFSDSTETRKLDGVWRGTTVPNRYCKCTGELMEFSQLDRITEIESGVRIQAIRKLRGDESYLRDHFPLFPVMPGVMIMESLFQASSWLLRYSNGFKDTICELREARNVKFQDFVEPGMELVVTSELLKQDGSLYTLKVSGTNGANTAVSARLILDCFSLGDRLSDKSYVDEDARTEYARQFAILQQG